VRLAILVPAEGFAEPWRWAYDVEAEALERGGADVVPVPWTEAAELAGFDLILPLVAWGYFDDYAGWLALLDRFEERRAPVVNPPAVLRWSSHKSYLAELGERGIPTVPTSSVPSCSEAHVAAARARFASDTLVIKPPVSGGAAGIHRLAPGDPLPASAVGQPTIIQPLMRSIATQGEYSLILFDGELSHCVVKRPKAGDFRVQPHLGGTTQPCPPPAGAEELARRALAAAPGGTTYARVDMIADDEGRLCIMELELVEPALFLDDADGAAQRFSAAVRSAAERARE
jgi:glutathione synthase/RimK-type ligase-like ATP-grasp enzyme